MEILRAAAEETDSAAASERAAEIIAAHGYDSADLTDFTEHHAEDPAYLGEVWSEIERRLRDPPPPDTSQRE